MKSTRHRIAQSPIVWGISIFMLAVILYWFTLPPDVLWGGGDFATYQRRAILNEIIEEDPGPVIFNHPLWVLLTHPFTKIPINSLAWRANMATAVFAVLALVLLFFTALEITKSKAASFLAVGALAVSHTFWTYAVMPKVYSLNALLLAACCLLLLLWRKRNHSLFLYSAALIYGVSFTNHLVMATALPAFTYWFISQIKQNQKKWQTSFITVACFILGLAPLFFLFTATNSSSAAGGKFFDFLLGIEYVLTHPSGLLEGIGWGIGLAVYQFPLVILLALWGIYFLWQSDRQVAWFTILGYAGALGFLLTATDPSAGGVYIWNLHYYLQGYVFLIFALAAGFKGIWYRQIGNNQWVRAGLVGATFLVPVCVYLLAPPVAQIVLSDIPAFRPLPGRDNFVYVLSPWKQNETGARNFGESIFDSLPADSVIFADYSIWAVLRYLQDVEEQRPDVELVQLKGKPSQISLILAYQDEKKLYLADTYSYYDMDGIQEHFELDPVGPIYQMTPKRIEP